MCTEREKMEITTVFRFWGPRQWGGWKFVNRDRQARKERWV